MPFDEWYDDDTREAATARVLERRATKPGDRNVLTVVADEFGIPQQTLRAWVEEAAPEPEKPARKPRPKFSQVVTTRIEPAPAPEVEPDADAEAEAEHQSEPEPPEEAQPQSESQRQPQPQPSAPVAAAEPDVETQPAPPAATPVAVRAREPHADEIAALEAEVVALRAGNRVLTEAMRVLLDP